jgi:hypothetical protein
MVNRKESQESLNSDITLRESLCCFLCSIHCCGFSAVAAERFETGRLSSASLRAKIGSRGINPCMGWLHTANCTTSRRIIGEVYGVLRKLKGEAQGQKLYKKDLGSSGANSN